MWEYIIRERLGSVDCGGEYGFKTLAATKAAFKKRYANWRELACTIYAPGYRPYVEKEAGKVRFDA